MVVHCSNPVVGLRGNPRLCGLFFHPNCRGPAGVLGGASGWSYPQTRFRCVPQRSSSRFFFTFVRRFQRPTWKLWNKEWCDCRNRFRWSHAMLLLIWWSCIIYIIYIYIIYYNNILIISCRTFMDRDIFYWEWESLSLIHCPYTVDRSSYSCASWLFQGKPSTQVRAALKVGNTFGNLGGYPRFNETRCIPLCHGCFKAAFSFIWTYWPQSMLKTRAFLALTKWDISLVALKTDASCSYQQSPNKSHVAPLGHHESLFFLLKGFPLNPFGIVMIHHPDIRGWAVR